MDQHLFNSKYELLTPACKTVLRCFLLGLDDEKIARFRVFLEDEEIMFLLSKLDKDEVFLLFSTDTTAHLQQQTVYKKLKDEYLAKRLFSLNDQIPDNIIKAKKGGVRRNLLNAAKYFEITGDFFREESIKLFMKHKRELVECEAMIIGWTPDIRDFSLEQKALDFIKKPASLVRVKSPYKMGKTFFVNKLLSQLSRDEDYLILSYSFDHCQQKTLEKYDILIKDMCRKFMKQVNPSSSLDQLEQWQNFILANANITQYFEQSFLTSTNKIILVLHNCDVIFEREYQDDFCNLLRSWIQNAQEKHQASSQLWNRLHIILTHSTDIYANLNIHCSPLNIGDSIELKPWQIKQVKDLSQQYSLELNQPDIGQLYQWLNGHPYLTNEVFKYLNEHFYYETIQEIANYRHLQSIGQIPNHLQRLLGILRESPDLVKAYRDVLNSEPIKLDTFIAWKLYSLGLIRIDEHYQSHCFCQLYRQYFLANL